MVTPTATAPAATTQVLPGTTGGQPPTVRRLVGEQILVLAGQGLSGLGNLAFLLVALRWLPAGQFADLATYLALYLLVQLPASALSAGSSLLAGARTRRTGVGLGIAAGIALAVAAPVVGPVLALAPVLVVLLAASLPAAAPLALARGRLYGQARPVAVAGTLVVEPVLRLSVGLVMLSAFGVVGGAVGVLLGGYAALAAATLANRGRAAVTGSPARLPWLAVVGFLGFAILQNQDLVFANGLLSAATAGTFAAVSTLGGIAAFATANIPLVMLPRAQRDAVRSRHATVVALALAVVIGALVVAAVALAPASVFTAVLGRRYAGVVGIATPYVAGMALLGVARVLGGRLVALGRTRLATALLLVAVLAQAAAICLAPRTVRGVAWSTTVTLAGLTAALAVASVVPSRARASVSWRDRVSWQTLTLVGAVTAVGVGLRLWVTRGLWVDEAISITQARLPFGDMLHNLRTTDVHPPGYFALLWGWIRVFGDGPLSVRMPSIIIGAALVPVIYLAARDLYGRRTAYVAAVFGAVAPQLVWYSQEARMYALFMLLVTLSVWAQVRALRNGSTRAWLVHGVLGAAMIWTQYFTVLVVLAQQLGTVVALAAMRRRREPVRRAALGWLAATALLLALVAPLLPFALDQFQTNQAAGRGFGGPATTARQVTQPGTTLSPYVVLANLLWAIWGYHPTSTMTALGALWPLGMLLALALLGRGRSRTTQLVLAAAVIPIVGMYAIGVEKRFLFDLRYFIGCVPLLLIVAARAVAAWPRRAWVSTVVATVATGSLALGLVDQQINGDNPRRYDFKPALARIGATAGPDDEVVLAPDFLHALATYYEPQLSTTTESRDPADTVSRTDNAEHVYVLGSFFDVGGEQQRVAALLTQLEKDRELVHTWRFSNVRVWEFR